MSYSVNKQNNRKDR